MLNAKRARSLLPDGVKVENRPRTSRGYWADGANDVAKASRYCTVQLTAAQVRILQSLYEAKRALSRKELKLVCGLSHKRGFPQRWVLQLYALSPSLVRVEETERQGQVPPKKMIYITRKGREALRSAQEAVTTILKRK